MKKMPIVPIPGDGQWTFQPIFVEDIPRYIEQGIKKNIVGTYLIAGAEAVSLNALIKRIMELAGEKKPVVHLPMVLVRWMSQVLEVCKIKPPLVTAQLKNMMVKRVYNIQRQIKVFGIKPTPLQEGLEKTVQEKYL